tara:strand:- start:8 stop:391 length:384 start_codon:yes stop_codon:yes gene_type:complete
MKDMEKLPKIEIQTLVDNDIALTEFFAERLTLGRENGSHLPIPILILSMVEKAHELLGIGIDFEMDNMRERDEDAELVDAIVGFCTESALTSLQNALPMELSITEATDKDDYVRIQAAIKLAQSPKT